MNGANAFYNTNSVDVGNCSNTYLTFNPNITNNDWCYIRQVGSDYAYKLAFDFHDDDNDARFCIRNVVQPANKPDTITEIFTVDNGNVSFTGSTTASGAISSSSPITASGAITPNSGQSTIKINYIYTIQMEE